MSEWMECYMSFHILITQVYNIVTMALLVPLLHRHIIIKTYTRKFMCLARQKQAQTNTHNKQTSSHNGLIKH